MVDRLQAYLDRQAIDLTHLQDQDVQAVLAAYQDARRQLLESLVATQGADTFRAADLQRALTLLSTDLSHLQHRLDAALDQALQRQRERALKDLLATFATAEPGFGDPGGAIQRAAQSWARADQLLGLHRTPLRRLTTQLNEELQRELVTAATRGLAAAQVPRRLAGPRNSVVAGMTHRVQLIARMELNRVYNAAHQAALVEAAAVLDAPDTQDPLLRRADERLDLRTHPLSMVLHGQVTALDKPWRVPIAQVTALATRRLGGVLWPRRGGHFEGYTYPAHFNERGVQIPWRVSWGHPHSGGTRKPKTGRWARPGVKRSVRDPRVEVQLHENACGAACAVMLTADRGISLEQAPLAANILTDAERAAQKVLGPAGITADRLADILNTAHGAPLVGPDRRWVGGSAPQGHALLILKTLHTRGTSWAMLVDTRGQEHWVVVDGLTPTGWVKIRDPTGHRRYIEVDTLLEMWPSRQFVIEPNDPNAPKPSTR